MTTGIRSDLVIDPSTRALVGERQATRRPVDLSPAGLTRECSSAASSSLKQIVVIRV
jgi:hypothetical protein